MSLASLCSPMIACIYLEFRSNIHKWMKYFKYSIYGQIIIFNWFPIKLLCLILFCSTTKSYKSETVDFVFLNVFSQTLHQHWYIIILKQRIICYGVVGIIGPSTSNEAYCVRLRVNNDNCRFEFPLLKSSVHRDTPFLLLLEGFT